MTVRGYIRVSTGPQVEGYSLTAQRTKIEAWAAYQRLSPVTIYEDAGVSGARDDRAGLTALLLDLQAGDVVVSYALSRLARGGAVQLLGIVRDIREKGARVVFLTENIDTETPTGRLMLTILAALAELEVEQTRERSLMGKTQAAVQGIYPQNPSTLPTGWTKGEDGRIVTDEHAETVRLIFSRGKASFRSTMTFLNEQGIPTRSGKKGAWEVFQVQRIVQCDAYWRGEWAYRGKKGAVHQILIPAPTLVTREEWEAAQRPRTYNALNRRPDLFPLTGHLRCQCGARITGANKSYVTQDGETKVFQRYACIVRSRRTPICSAYGKSAPHFKPAPLHQQAREQLAALLTNPADPAQTAAAWNAQPSTDPHAQERIELTRKLDSLVDLYLEGLVDKGGYTERRLTLTQRLAQLERPTPQPAVMTARPDLAQLVLQCSEARLSEVLDLLDVEYTLTGRNTLELTRFKALD